MKTILKLVSASIFIFCIYSCYHPGNRIVINNGKDYLEIRFAGEVRFTEDETAVQSISNNGFLKYRKNNRKLSVKYSAEGKLQYQIDYDGQTLSPESEEGKKFISEAIHEMSANGLDVQGHFLRLIKKGGYQAVLTEIDRLENDFTKSRYLEYLIKSDSIAPRAMADVARKIETNIGSDFEKSQLLRKFPDNVLTDSVTSMAYLQAAKSIGSDFEKANVLKFIARKPFTQSQCKTIVDVSNTLDSDFEKANMLKELITKKIYDGECFQSLLKSVDQISSDFEKAGLIKLISNQEIRSNAQWVSLIEVTTHLDSEFERANALIQIADKMPPSDDTALEYLKAAKTIGSDIDYQRTVKALN